MMVIEAVSVLTVCAKHCKWVLNFSATMSCNLMVRLK